MCRWDRIDGTRTIRSVNGGSQREGDMTKQSATTDAEGLKEGIGCMPMDGTCR